jgi:lysozyme family protein
MTDLAQLETMNTQRWDAMHLKAARIGEFHETAIRLSETTTKARYQGVTDRLTELAATNSAINPVPWWFVAIVSEREYGPDRHGNMRWDCQLGQGDPLDQKSIHVPQGMGPYLAHPGDVTPGHDAWTRCCVDVLINSAPFIAKRKMVTIGGVLVGLLEYNGLGYDAHGRPSPYLWAGSDQYISGKYVRDGVYDPSYVDKQLGCAGILAMMMVLDTTIQIEGA